MSRRLRLRATLLLVSLLLTWGVAEFAMTFFFLEPTPFGSASLFGQTLPPLRPFAPTSSQSYQDRVQANSGVEGVTRGDLWGIMREDPLLGYVPQEATRSAQGWWRTNQLGARMSQECRPLLPGAERLVVVGDSYAQASRVHQDDTWNAQLNRSQSKFEAVNFGVDGYNMAQSYLRYQQVKGQLDHGWAVIFFVPRTDLWREVNVSRRIGAQWKTRLVTPRFKLTQGGLELVTHPYSTAESLVEANYPLVSPELDRFLRANEALYLPELYRPMSLLQKSVLYRWSQAVRGRKRLRALKNSFYAPDSEAVRLSRAIFEAMADEVESDRRRFLLVLIPEARDVSKYRTDPEFRRFWERLSRSASGQLQAIDLMTHFQKLPAETVDSGADGTHFGPRANGVVAQALLEHLRKSR